MTASARASNGGRRAGRRPCDDGVVTTSGDPRQRPIAVFDSGVGGLTVLHELLVSLPNEDYLYLGDTRPLPLRRAESRRARALQPRDRRGAAGAAREAVGRRLQLGDRRRASGAAHADDGDDARRRRARRRQAGGAAGRRDDAQRPDRPAGDARDRRQRRLRATRSRRRTRMSRSSRSPAPTSRRSSRRGTSAVRPEQVVETSCAATRASCATRTSTR